MGKKKVLLMVNPNAGAGNSADVGFRIIESLAVRGCEVTCYPLLPTNELQAESILSDHPERYDLIVLYGGDGTLNRIVSYMVDHRIDVPIGYIAGGTTNDFSKSFSGAETIDGKCEDIVNGKVFRFDVGKFNDRYFNYIAAFGAFTWTSYQTPREAKALLGYTAYVLNGIGTLSSSLTYRRHLVIEHDGKTIEGNYIYGGISNAESVAGMKFSFIQNTSLNDGLFEVILINAPDNMIEAGVTVADIMSGRDDGVYVTTFRTNHLTIHCDEGVAWTLDGEDGGTYNDVEFTVVPEAMQIMISASSDKI